MRSAPFVIGAVLLGVAFSWFYQFHFGVPRERQDDLFPRLAMITAAVLLLGRAAVVTFLQRRQRP